MRRESSALGLLLSIHLATVLAHSLGMPFGKFVHGVYRYAALVRDSLEGA